MPRSSLPKIAPSPPTAPPAWFRLKRMFGLAAGAASVPATTWPGAAGADGANGDAAPMPKVTDYALQHVIARNDRATIYRATERATGRLIALKTVRIGSTSGTDRGLWRERFLREAAAAARLRHEYIVTVHAGGVQGEGEATTGWLAMEWVHGTDMSRYACTSRLLPEAVVVGICQRVALALELAHRSGIVHRDIKPSNVLFDPTTGTVKVTDFGSARVADTAATRSGLMLGTPAYMAPEQLAGADATAQCDLYALGVLLFELLIGRRPFESDSMGDLLARIAHQAAPSVRALRPELPPLLDDIVARLLAKSPGLRQESAHQAALELRLARQQCAAAAPGSAAADWPDTAPGYDPLDDMTASPPFQGTIAS
jgi:eukaryotic-like serine/threonine-protein kinase